MLITVETVIKVAYQSSTLTIRTISLEDKDSRAFLSYRTVVDRSIMRSYICQIGFLLPELTWENLKNRRGEQWAITTTSDNKTTTRDIRFVR